MRQNVAMVPSFDNIRYKRYSSKEIGLARIIWTNKNIQSRIYAHPHTVCFRTATKCQEILSLYGRNLHILESDTFRDSAINIGDFGTLIIGQRQESQLLQYRRS